MMLGGAGMMTKCPCCRQKYISFGGSSGDSDDEYAGMPPLIPQIGLHDIYEEPELNNQVQWNDNLIAMTPEENASNLYRYVDVLSESDAAIATAAAVAALTTLSNGRHVVTLNTISEFINEMNQIQLDSTQTQVEGRPAGMPNQRTMD
jgi:hypothetical protein